MTKPQMEFRKRGIPTNLTKNMLFIFPSTTARANKNCSVFNEVGATMHCEYASLQQK
jgi:hypothetical protein